MSANWINQEALEHQKQLAETHLTASEAKRVRAASGAISLRESEHTEKTLHHLAGRVEELRVRLERVLVPVGASGNPAIAPNANGESLASPLTERLKSFRKLAQGSIDIVEDILNRLDV